MHERHVQNNNDADLLGALLFLGGRQEQVCQVILVQLQHVAAHSKGVLARVPVQDVEQLCDASWCQPCRHSVVHADSVGEETCTTLFRPAKIMHKLPNHCSVTNGVTDLQECTRRCGSVHKVAIKENACAYIVSLIMPMLNCGIQGMNLRGKELCLCLLTSKCVARVTTADSKLSDLVSPGLSSVP